MEGGGGQVPTMSPPSVLDHIKHLEHQFKYYIMWKEHQAHQNEVGMGHGRRGGRCAKHHKKADLPYAQLSVQIQNYEIIDLIYQYYDAILASEYLDHEGEGWSDGVVQTCLPKLLHNIQWIKNHLESGYMELIYAQR